MSAVVKIALNKARRDFNTWYWPYKYKQKDGFSSEGNDSDFCKEVLSRAERLKKLESSIGIKNIKLDEFIEEINSEITKLSV